MEINLNLNLLMKINVQKKFQYYFVYPKINTFIHKLSNICLRIYMNIILILINYLYRKEILYFN